MPSLPFLAFRGLSQSDERIYTVGTSPSHQINTMAPAKDITKKKGRRRKARTEGMSFMPTTEN